VTRTTTDRRTDPGHSAARTVALQVGGAAAVLVLVVVASALLFDRAQARDVTDSVRTAATTADDAGDPPPGVWVVLDRAGRTESTAGTPREVLTAATTLLRSGRTDGPATLTTGNRRWPAWRSTRDGLVAVAVYDESRHTAEEARLLRAVTLAGVGGVALAVLVGLLAGRRAVRPLATALRLQDEFVADASHELRTPLAVVSTRAQLLRRRLPPDAPEAVRREADLLVADTRALGEVVAELLRAAQLEHVPEVAVVVDVRGLAAEVVASMAPYAQERDVSLSLETGGATDPLPVDAVPSSLRRALVALVDNAIAHSPAGAGVELRAAPDASSVRLEVVDHGEGVEAEEVDSLTDRFRRGNRASAGGHQRVGLGLALVRQVVRSHRGELELGPTPGGGATFALVLPGSSGGSSVPG
jgi:signal transduction histidine kinase